MLDEAEKGYICVEMKGNTLLVYDKDVCNGDLPGLRVCGKAGRG